MTIDATTEGITDADAESQPEKQWKPIGRELRRVLAVLIEKAKTTPDNYPMSLSAIVTGSNQKSNRDPVMNLNDDEVTEALDTLRELGAASEIQGSGRVNKFRHRAYEWFGINARESAVVTELLLRGPQTVGELRTRASRMEPFANLDEVQVVLDDLASKNLVEPLTPAGRGQTFGHTLYEPQERPKMLDKAGVSSTAASQRSAISREHSGRAPIAQAHPSVAAETAGAEVSDLAETVEILRVEVAELRNRLQRLENELGVQN
jgi:hypothetical protein